MNQSLPPQNIIVVDDGSIDESLQVLRLLKSRHPNLYILENGKNLGTVLSYNRGLRFVKSPLVYFAAADDLVSPDLFEICSRALKTSSIAAFASAEAKVVEKHQLRESLRPIIRPSQRLLYLNPDLIRKEFRSNDNWIMTGACVFRSKYVKELGGMPISLGSFADSIMAKKLAFRYGCVFIPYIGVTWNISENSFSRQTFKNLDTFIELKMLLKAFITSDDDFPKWYWLKYSRRLNFAIVKIALDSKSPNDEILKRFLGRIFTESYAILGNYWLFRKMLLIFSYFRYYPFAFSRIIRSQILRYIFKSE